MGFSTKAFGDWGREVHVECCKRNALLSHQRTKFPAPALAGRVLPAGLQRVGAAAPSGGDDGGATDGAAAAAWTSKYAVVGVVPGNMSLPDGMNEKGLVVNQVG